MTSTSSTTPLHPLSSVENDSVATSISQMPGYDLLATARATVHTGQMYQSGALALLREASTNQFILMLLDTTEGETLWFQALTPDCRLQRANGHSHHYSLGVAETDETAEMTFCDDREEDSLIEQIDITKGSRRLTKLTVGGEDLDGDEEDGDDDALISSPKEITNPLKGDIRGTPRVNEGVSAPCRKEWSSVSAARATSNDVKQRRNTVPIVKRPSEGSGSYSASRIEGRTCSSEKVENWLLQMPISPTTTSAPLRSRDHAAMDESIAVDRIFDANASSYPGALSPTGSASWHMRFPALRRRRRGVWKTRIRDNTYEVPDVSHDLKVISSRVDGGGFGTIYQGYLDGEKVAIKQVKQSSGFARKIKMKDSKRFRAEVVVAMLCATMGHEHLMAFRGVAMTETLGACLVLPWMKNGNSLEYIQANLDVSRFPIILGTLKGLEHLHKHHFVHGDIKAHNVLISDDGVPVISDFGLATREDIDGEPTSVSIQRAGNARWKAPELQEDECVKRTKESDMWAFGMFIIEILTGELPFANASTPTIMLAVQKSELPERPSHPECSNELWIITQKCWEKSPGDRISARRALRNLSKPDGGGYLSSEDGICI